MRGLLYTQLGDISRFQGNFDIALENFNKAVENFNKYDHKDGYLTALNEVALIKANYGEL